MAQSAGASRMKWSAPILVGIILLLAGLIFYVIYVTNPTDDHYNALLLIGSLALVFAILSYLAQALSRDPVAQRAVAWGFYGMGFAILLLTLTLAPEPNGSVSRLDRIISILLVLILLAASVVWIFWRRRTMVEEKQIKDERAAWASQPAPNAFNYTTAGQPPPNPPNSPPRSP